MLNNYLSKTEFLIFWKIVNETWPCFEIEQNKTSLFAAPNSTLISGRSTGVHRTFGTIGVASNSIGDSFAPHTCKSTIRNYQS